MPSVPLRLAIALLAALAIAVSIASPSLAQDREIEFVHPDGYFSLKHPAGWGSQVLYNGQEFQTVLAPADAVGENPDRAFRVILIPAPDAEARAKLARHTELLAEQLAETLRAAEIVSRRETRVGGRDAFELEISQPTGDDDGDRIRGHIISVVSADAIFQVIYYGPADDWRAVGPTFDAILRSLTFRPARLASARPSPRTEGFSDPEGTFRMSIPDNWNPVIKRSEKGELEYEFMPRRVLQAGEGSSDAVFMVRHFEAPAGTRLAAVKENLKNHQLKTTEGLSVREETEVVIAGHTAVRVRYRSQPQPNPDGEETRVAIWDTYYLLAGNRVFILMAAAPEATFPLYADAFDRMARSLRAR